MSEAPTIAVWSEIRGNCHSTPDYKFGVPAALDDSGHEVTMREWWGVPWGGPGEEPGATS